MSWINPRRPAIVADFLKEVSDVPVNCDAMGISLKRDFRWRLFDAARIDTFSFMHTLAYFMPSGDAHYEDRLNEALAQIRTEVEHLDQTKEK